MIDKIWSKYIASQAKSTTRQYIFLRTLALFINLLSQLLIPIIITSRLGFAAYGKWVFAISLTGFISFLDLGLIASISTSVMTKKGHSFEVQEILLMTSLRKLILFIYVVASMLTSTYLLLYLQSHSSASPDIHVLVSFALLNSLALFLLRYFEASFRSAGSTYGYAVCVMNSLASALTTLFFVFIKSSLVTIMFANFVISLLFVLSFAVKKDSFSSVSTTKLNPRVGPRLKSFLPLGLTYLLFPIGYLILNEGLNIAVSRLAGYEILGTLGLVRAISGVYRQLTSLIVNSFLPSLTLLVKASQLRALGIRFASMKRSIYRLNAVIFIILSLTAAASSNYSSYLHSRIHVALIFAFMSSALMDVPWNTWLALGLASNSYRGIAFLFPVTSLVTILICAPAFHFFGIYGIALSLLVQDFILTKPAITNGMNILNGERDDRFS